jgi:hypothetical protein
MAATADLRTTATCALPFHGLPLPSRRVAYRNNWQSEANFGKWWRALPLMLPAVPVAVLVTLLSAVVVDRRGTTACPLCFD